MSRNKIYILIFLLLITTIIYRGYHALHNPLKDALKEQVGETVSFTGTISTEPLIKDFIQTFVLVTEENHTFRVGADRFGDYEYGDSVKITGKLSAPRNFEGNGGRTFDYINYLGKDDIYYEFKKAVVEMVEKNDGKNIQSILFKIKRKFLDNLALVLGEPHASLAGGLVVGEKAALGKDLIDDFRRSGLIHIVVLSGYNITIIAAMIRRILSFLPRNAGIILGGVGIILFGMLVGGGATVIRSCIMAIIALSAEFLRKDYNVARALFIAGLFMLVENPLILFYDPSFQLSFLATLGLITLSSPFEKLFPFITEKFGIRSLVASTLATQVFVSPYIFYMMGDLSVIGILVNIIVLPFIPLTMLFVFLAGMLGFVWKFASEIMGWGSHLLLSYELFIVEKSSRLPFAIVSLPAFSIRFVGAVYLVYWAVFVYVSSRRQNSSQSPSS